MAKKGQIIPPERRFAAYVVICPETGCWNWSGGKKATGYGIFGISPGRSMRAHRFAYEMYVGPIPVELEVCHRCDNRACVNPKHLFLGTHQDNIRDRTAKGREARGDKIGIAKLDWPKVGEIRSLLARGELQRVIADKFGVDPSVISEIKTEKIWKPQNSL